MAFVFNKNALDLIPESWSIVNLITEDKGGPRSVGNVLSDPIHLRHNPIHLAEIPT